MIFKTLCQKNARGGEISKKRDFCCFFGFFVIFGARHSLSGVARARIIFLVTHMIFKKIFLNFGVHTSKSWNPQILTPQKFLRSLSLQPKKNFGAISFIIFSSGFNYGTSTKIINYRKNVFPPPLKVDRTFGGYICGMI